MVDNAAKDQNDVSTLLAVSNSDNRTPVKLWADPVTHRLLTDESGGGGTPAAPDTSVQFNDGGVFGGDAGLTYNKTTDYLTVGNITGTAGGDFHFLTPSANTGNALTITLGSAVSGDNSGGALTFNGGAGKGGGEGGALTFQSGSGDDEGDGNGGAISFFAGNAGESTSNGSGGDVAFASGNGGNASGPGGNISLTAGDAQGGNSAGGGITLASGASTGSGNAGSTSLSGGQGGTTGIGGGFSLSAGAGGSASGAGGTVNVNGGNAQGGTSTGGGVTLSGGASNGAAQAGNISLNAGGTGGGFQQTTGGVNIVDPENDTGFQSVRKILTYTGATTTFTIIPSSAIVAGKNVAALIEIRASVVVNQNSEGVAEGAFFVRRASFASNAVSGFVQAGSTQEVYTEVDTDTSAVNLTIQLSTGNISTTLTNGNAGTVQWVCEVFYIISTITHI